MNLGKLRRHYPARIGDIPVVEEMPIPALKDEAFRSWWQCCKEFAFKGVIDEYDIDTGEGVERIALTTKRFPHSTCSNWRRQELWSLFLEIGVLKKILAALPAARRGW